MRNFKLLFLLMLGMFVMFQSCEKKGLQTEKEQEVSENKADWEKEFRQELIVSDEDENTFFYYVYSDDEELLSNYLRAHEFTLNTEGVDKEVLKTDNLTEFDIPEKELSNYDIDQEPKIIFELVRTNLKEDVQYCSLQITNTSKDFIVGYPIGYMTGGGFIGVIHRGNGYEFIARFRYKLKWYSSWKYLGGNFFVYPAYNGYSAHIDRDFYKCGITIWPHHYQNTQNYVIVYSKGSGYSRDCAMGNYDYNNYGECFVGSVPTGTSAFVWGTNSNNRAFYYTPRTWGEKCPRAGSWFDGANCYAMPIPSGVVAYTWQRNMLVKSEIEF